MKVLVLGESGATHALVWKLFNSNHVDKLVSMPGNGGAGVLAPIAPALDSIDAQVRWAYEQSVKLIVPSSGMPLAQGLTDDATPLKVAVWGPPRQSAFFAISRLWTKEFLNRHSLPTSAGRAFIDFQTAERYLAAQTLPVNLWNDYPSEYDGAYSDRSAAMTALKEIFALPPRDGNLRGVVIEAPQVGPTISLSCLTDGTVLRPLLPVRIYDRLEDGDGGWAAPGMGAYTSDGGMLARVGDYIYKQALEPLFAAIKQEQLPWWGILGVDCTITAQGPRITNIRSTLGDPETQVLMPRLENDLMQLIAACHNGNLDQLPPLRWKQRASVGVTLVAQGYPHSHRTGLDISGLGELESGVLGFQHKTENPVSMDYVPDDPNAEFTMTSSVNATLGDIFSSQPDLHGGPARIISHGGRIVTIVALGDSLDAARTRAYANLQRISVPQSYHRTDIASREL